MTVRSYFSDVWRGGAGFLSVLYHATVRDIRSAHANAFIAIGSEIAQALVLVILIMVFLNALGIGRLMVRGNAMLSVLTGVFLFLIYTRAFSRVISSAVKAGKMVRHRSTPPVLMYLSAALASLYIQVLALLVMLLATHVLFAPVVIDAAPRAALAVGLAWFSGLGAGVLAVSLRPYAPKLVQIAGSFYSRGNMFFSGKMVLAGSLSATVLQYFTWNPLFHAIDQARGAVFINYTATTTNLLYPFAVGAMCLLLGMMIGQRSNRLVPVTAP